MKTTVCPACGGKMKRNGKTKAGTQRWRCVSCGLSTTHHYDQTVKLFVLFLRWLLSKKTQNEMGMPARTFRDKTARFWDIWPISPVCDEIHHVIYVDGIWLKKICVILIARSETNVIGWYLARSENSQAWASLMLRIAPPDVVITDGGGGFEKARQIVWPNTRVQRCLFHAFSQVKRCTTTRPKTQAGIDLYSIAKALLNVKEQQEAITWLISYQNWCSKYEKFLSEKTVIDGRSQYKHERLRKARRALNKLCKDGTLFTFLDDDLKKEGAIPSTTNKIEGDTNRQIREVLNNHRGMRLERMIKAAFWYCYSKLECPMALPQILKTMPTDKDIEGLYKQAQERSTKEELVECWGKAVSWSDLHTSNPYRIDWD